ncbi:MAG: ISKra4 family transposase, partial [Aestuariibacter sp.]|nr:ISKra4 family transposase [Aestuariibacter sp.]
MGCAALAFMPPDPLREVRKVAHQQLDKWLDQMKPLFDQEKPPTLLELSKHFTQTRTTLLGGVLQSISESLYVHFLDQKQCSCPECATVLNRKRVDAKQFNTLQGVGTLERPYFYCRDCKIGFHPLDEALELTRAFHQYDIEEKVLKLATEMPYERAAELVSELTGVPVSNHHGHNTLIQVAEIADLETVIPDTEEIAQRIEQAKQTPDDKPVLVVALDGAHAPTRPRAKRNGKRGAGKWREVKGVRFYLAPEDGRIIQIASWHQIQDAEATQRDIKKIAARIPQEKVRIALLGDGAAWVWNNLSACFPDGKQVLDYYHCSEHIHKVAEAHYGTTPKAIEWVEATMARLAANQVDTVIWGLQRLQADVFAQEEIDKLITYLDNQRDRLNYNACKEEGIPIGSGGIESANKFISHIRLKRSGAWWVVENGN